MTGQPLPDNHRRVLSVVARNIERSMDDIEELFARKDRQSRLHHIAGSYSEEQKKEILGRVSRLRERLAHFVRDFHLEGESRSEQQIIDTKVTHMWMLLEDSYSGKLKKYGKTDGTFNEKLDASVADLLRLVRDLERLK